MQTSHASDIKAFRPYWTISGIKKTLRNILFLFFFVPFSIGEITANYSFVALFIISKFKAARNIPFSVLAYIGFILLSYIYGFIIISKFDPYYLSRASISFYSYLLFVLLLVVKIDYSSDQICKAVFWVSIIYSFYIVINIAFRPEFSLSDPYYVKRYMRNYIWGWPQRFPIMISFSVFYCLKLLKVKKIYLLFLILLLTCSLLTFTRSIYVALFCGGFSYFIINLMNSIHFKKGFFTIRRSKIIGFLIFIVIVFVSIRYLAYFDQTGSIKKIIERSATSISSFLTGHEARKGSDSERIMYWSYIIDISRTSPLFGSGFANIYLFNPNIGSAHSQYMDILIRTGYLGLAFYLFFWVKAIWFYLRNDIYIFCGLISVFVYGCFNETTKLTYCGVLFFLLLNKSLSGRKQRSINFGKKDICAESQV